VCGLLVWIAGVAPLIDAVPEKSGTVAGSLLTAAGMWWNSRNRHRARCDQCMSKDHSKECP
jgi:hypothetical protein